MLPRWRTITATAAIAANTITGQGSPSASPTNGSATAVTIDASDA